MVASVLRWRTLVKDYPVLAGMVGGMDKHSLALLNKMREAAI